jgi:hypothetical protein
VKDLEELCPSCGAFPGKPCLTAAGRILAAVHQQRTAEGRELRRLRREADRLSYHARLARRSA